MRSRYYIKAPGVVAHPGSTSELAVSGIDFYATILEIVGVAVEHRITTIADVTTIFVGKGSARILVKFYFVIWQLLLHYVGEGHRDTAANIR